MTDLIDDVEAHDPVRRITSHGAITIDERLSLRAMSGVLSDAGVGLAVVERSDGSVGVVTERDVVRALGSDADPDVVWVADVMSEDLVIAEIDEPIADVAERMVAENVRHVLVVDRGTVVGVTSMRDVLAVLL